MKKCFFYAGALAMLLSSCSNDDAVNSGPSTPEGGAAVESLKVSLVSGTSSKSSDENGVGSENTLTKSYVFVQNDDDGPDSSTKAYAYKYKYVVLNAGQNATVVKWVKPGSKVYVYANAPYMDDDVAKVIVDGANEDGDAGPDEFFQLIDNKIDKKYIVGLNATNGKFMMTGSGVVPQSTSGASQLSVALKRDLAKVDFNVKKKGAGASGEDVEVVSVEEVTIRRSADYVQPFAMENGAATTYVLPYGFGHSLYKQDGLTDGGFKPSNESATADATDYSFIYGSSNITIGNDAHALNPIYVLPNAAKTAEKGTIIVVKATVKITPSSGGTAAESTKYYKARISSGMDAYSTNQNAKYSITATIKGAGSDTPTGPSGPDTEDTENDLNIDVKVQPWSLIISNQEIG